MTMLVTILLPQWRKTTKLVKQKGRSHNGSCSYFYFISWCPFKMKFTFWNAIVNVAPSCNCKSVKQISWPNSLMTT